VRMFQSGKICIKFQTQKFDNFISTTIYFDMALEGLMKRWSYFPESSTIFQI